MPSFDVIWMLGIRFSTVLHINSIVTLFLFAKKQRLDEFFDINDGTKTPNMNLAIAKFMLLICWPASDKLAAAARHHDQQYPHFYFLMATTFDHEKTVVLMMNPARASNQPKV